MELMIKDKKQQGSTYYTVSLLVKKSIEHRMSLIKKNKKLGQAGR